VLSLTSIRSCVSMVIPSYLQASAGWHLDCLARAMLDVTLSVLGMIAGGVVMELFAPAIRRVASPHEECSLELSEDFGCGNPS